jgi:hypothetical protein
VHDVSCDITPLLTSFPSSESPDVQCAIGIGHPGVVIGDVAHSSCPAPFVRDTTQLFLVSVPIAEQALINARAVTCGVPIPFAPLAALVVLLRAMFSPVCKVVKAGVKHSLWDIRGHWGIVEDAWLEATKGIGASEGLQGVLFFPACVVIQLLEVGQVFSQIPDLVMGVSEALYFGTEGFVSFLSDSEVDHWHEHLSGKEGVRLFAGEDSSRVRVLPRSEGA